MSRVNTASVLLVRVWCGVLFGVVWCVLFGVLDFRYERICFKLTLEDEFAVVKTV